MLDAIQADRKTAVVDFLLAMADDEFFTGHRLGMWLAVSPTFEEDNTLTSIAQDELGHARLWFDIVAEERNTTVDDLAIERPAPERRNTILVERKYDDFADTISRSYLYDEAERRFLESIRDGSVRRLSDAAEVALSEEPFHRSHTEKWLEILEATEESTERLDRAFHRNLEATTDLFSFDDEPLVETGVLARAPGELAEDWEAAVIRTVSELPIDVSGEDVPALRSAEPEPNGRAGEHTEDLAELIDSMQPREIERI